MSDVISHDQELIDIKSFAPEEQQKARSIAAGIKVDDSQAVIQYGVGAQANISSFADTILTQIRSKDTGYVGEVLTDLVVKVKDLKVGDLGQKSGIPFFGGMMNKIKRFIARYDKVSVQIEKIVGELDEAKMGLLKDIQMLDNLYNKNRDYLKDLDIYIAAGQIKLQELTGTELPKLEAKAQESGDPADAQALNDFTQALNRFEKKLHDLKLSRMISIQTAPQIRLIQNNDQTLVEKIQSSILTTIPLWKNQIIIAISLFRQKKALELQKEVTDTTNDLLARNSAMLKQGSLDVARESERGIVEIETLKKVNDDLISTIEETLQIQSEGRAKRAEAEQELVKMEGDLKAKLRQVKA